MVSILKASLFIRIGLVCALLLSGCGTRIIDQQQVAPNERIVIKFSHVVAENAPKGLAAQRFADLVRERTGGYVEIQVFPESKLFKDGEELEALRNGEVQLLAPATAKLSKLSPDWQVLDLPYAFPDATSFHALMDGPAGQILLNKLKAQGLMGLAVWDNGFKQITNNQRPLTKPEDFRGLSFRVMPSSRLLVEQFNTLGAMAKPMPFSDVFSALNDGGVDGQENTISNIYTKHFNSVQHYLTLSNHGYLAYVVLTNARFWNSLPEGVRTVLQETLAEVTEWEREKAKEVDEDQLEKLRLQKNIQIQELTEGERQVWERAFQPVYSKIEKEVTPELLRSVRQLRATSD